MKDRAAAAIRTALASEYPNLRVIVEGRKRSILVSFGGPVTRTEKDFTADVIVAIDNPTGPGLYIPRYDTWDRSHPEMHTVMVRNAVHSSDVTFARVAAGRCSSTILRPRASRSPSGSRELRRRASASRT